MIILVDINECASNPCKNNGVCIDGINAFTCNCKDGYIGLECETGEIHSFSNWNKWNVIVFFCNTVWTYLIIIIADVDECKSNPCNNGGRCVDGVNGYACNCTDGYIGLQCETGVSYALISW